MNRQHAIIYTRVSTEKQNKSQLGVEAQLKACEDFCKREGLSVIDVRSECASGADDNRPVLHKAIRDAKRAEAYVVVARLCRLSRKVSMVSKLMEQQVPFVTVEFGMEVNPLMLHIFSAVYQEQRAYISQRTKEALAAKKARGEKLGNPNWEDGLSTGRMENIKRADKFALDTFPIIDGIMRAGAITYQSIADALNARGIRTRSNKPGSQWHPATVKNLMMRVEALKKDGVIPTT